MAVKIRLRRMGAKKAPFYRVVVADSRYPRDGRFIEEIGTYDVLKNPSEFKVVLLQRLHIMVLQNYHLQQVLLLQIWRQLQVRLKKLMIWQMRQCLLAVVL